MLTIKLITEQTERVIKGLEKKHFGNAVETINQVIELDKKRRAAQTALDRNLAEAKQMAARIGALMKEGKREEAETVKAEVAALKTTNAALEEEMKQAAEDTQNLLYTIPNIPYDEVPEGAHAEDNVVEKTGNEVPDTDHSLAKAIYDESYAVIRDETNFSEPSVRPQDDTAVLTINATDKNGLIYRGIINIHYDYDVGVENTTIDLSGAIRTHYRNFRNSSYYYCKLRQEDVTNYYIVTGTDRFDNPYRMFFAVGQCIEPTWPSDRWNEGKINSLSFDMVNLTLTADYDEDTSGRSGIFYLLWDFTNNKWLPDIETAAANNNANCVEIIYEDKTHSISSDAAEFDWNHFKTIGEVISIPAKYVK